MAESPQTDNKLNCRLISDGTCTGTLILGPDGEQIHDLLRIRRIEIMADRGVDERVQCRLTVDNIELDIDSDTEMVTEEVGKSG